MAITFDTLKFVKTLESAGVPAKQAEAQAEALSAAMDTADVATKSDINLVRKDIDLVRKDIDLVRSDLGGQINLLRWMMGVLIAGVLALIIKAYF